MKKKLFVSLLSTLIILYLIPSRDVFASIINESYSSDGIKTYYVSTEQEKTTVLNFIKANMETVVNIVYSGDTVPKSKDDLYYYYLYDAYNNSNIYQDDVSLYLNKISLCDGFPVETATFNDKDNTVLVTYNFTYFDTEEQSESNNTILNEAIIENISSLKSDYDKALWAYQWVINELHYDVTLRNFSINSGLIGDGTICVGYAALYNALANKLGLTCRLVEGSVYNNDGNNHDWNIVATLSA
jgi:transglutaminase/protease-like cytokinesis protein 3